MTRWGMGEWPHVIKEFGYRTLDLMRLYKTTKEIAEIKETRKMSATFELLENFKTYTLTFDKVMKDREYKILLSKYWSRSSIKMYSLTRRIQKFPNGVLVPSSCRPSSRASDHSTCRSNRNLWCDVVQVIVIVAGRPIIRVVFESVHGWGTAAVYGFSNELTNLEKPLRFL